MLIGLGNELPAIAPAHRDEQHLIEGCQSRVWVDARLEEGKVYYSADSDAIITKGIIALLIRVLNGRTPQQVLDTDRPHWVAREPVAYAGQRFGGDDKANEALRPGIRGGRKGVKGR